MCKVKIISVNKMKKNSIVYIYIFPTEQKKACLELSTVKYILHLFFFALKSRDYSKIERLVYMLLLNTL